MADHRGHTQWSYENCVRHGLYDLGFSIESMNRNWTRLVGALSVLAVLVAGIGALASIIGGLLGGSYAAPALLVLVLLLVLTVVTVIFTSVRLLPSQSAATPYW